MLKKIAVVVAVGFAAVALPVSAFAQGTGYEGDTGATGVPGGFQTVIANQTVSSSTSAQTVTGTDGAYTVTVNVPSGAFTQAECVTLTSANTSGIGNGGVSGDSAVIGLGINVSSNCSTGSALTGTSTSGPWVSALQVAINGTFNPSDTVVFYNVQTGTWQPLTGATISATSITFNITADPDVAVLAPGSASSGATPTVANATTVATGKPFLLEEIIAGALVAFGLAALFVFRVRRRRPSTRQG